MAKFKIPLSAEAFLHQNIGPAVQRRRTLILGDLIKVALKCIVITVHWFQWFLRITNQMIGLHHVIIEVYNRERAIVNPALVFVSAVVYFAQCPAEAKPNEPGRKFENVRCNDEDKRS